MAIKACFLTFLALCMISFESSSFTCGNESNETTIKTKSLVHVGVVLDLNTQVGAMADVSMSVALDDFYAIHPNYTTRLVLHTRDSEEDDLGAAAAVIDLLKNVRVQTIIGPQTTPQVKLVTDIGQKKHVPIISFSATSPCISPSQSPYFIRAAQNDSSQVKAITAIIEGFDWHEVILIYEDAECTSGIIQQLSTAFEEINVHVPYMKAISTSSRYIYILRELKKVRAMQTRVILVHVSSPLGSRLFQIANELGMIKEGYAWLITDVLSNSLGEMDPLAIASMEGVLALRPYVPRSEQLQKFKSRWERLYSSMKPNSSSATELNIFGLWAYDTVYALALAVERIGLVKTGFTKVDHKHGKRETDRKFIEISGIGPRILDEMLNTKLTGLSGEFQLVGGNLQPSAFEILNVLGKGERIIGYWSLDRGISRTLGSRAKVPYSTSTNQLKIIIWPGDSAKKPEDRGYT